MLSRPTSAVSAGMTLALLTAFSAPTAHSRDIYVAPAGDDLAAGTLTAPYRTVARAAEEAQAGDVVLLREGAYSETLQPANSGTADAPIVFRAYQGEKVVITAMEAVNGWVRDAGDVFRAQVEWDMGDLNFVMHEGTALDLARWPDNVDGKPFTQDTVRNTGGSAGDVVFDAYLGYDPGLPEADWANGGTIWFYGDKPGSGWLAWKRFITASTDTRISFDLETRAGLEWIRTFHAPADKGDFYLEGVREVLDHENEWYFDATAMELFVQLPGGEQPQDGKVRMRRREFTVNLRDRSYIEIRNLALFGGSVEVTGRASNNLLHGLSVFYGNHIRGVSTNFLNFAQSVKLGGRDNTLEHSEVAFGTSSGVRDQGIGNKILNSHIHDFNTLGSYDAVVSLRGNGGDTGRDSIVRGNTLSRGGRDTAQVSNRNTEFSYNDVSASNLVADDSALFYSTGGDTEGRYIDIHHNWFHDTYSPGAKRKAAGIYLDTNPENFRVHHNVIWNTEWSNIQMNWNAKDIEIFNNTLINGSTNMGAWHRAGTLFTNVKVWNNLSDKSDWEPQSDQQNNLTYGEDPFVASADDNYLPRAGTAPVDAGRVIAGVTNDVQGAAPDIGAYESGGTQWTAGADWSVTDGAAGRCYDLPGESCITVTDPGEPVTPTVPPSPDPPSPDRPSPDPSDDFICLTVPMRDGRIAPICMF